MDNTYKKTNNPTATYGENSASNLALQKSLNKKNAGVEGWTPLKEDGKYGPLTQAAVNFKPSTGSGGGSGEATIEKAFNYDVQDDPYSDVGNYYKQQFTQEIDPQAIYNQKLNQWQGYMDSLRSVYANKAAEVDKQIMGQLGTNRATQARSGLIGSTFGGAQTSKINQAGIEQKNLLADEMDAKIRYLMGEIDRDASAEIAARRQAIAQGAESYTNFLAGSQQRKLEQVNRIMGGALDQGFESIDEIGQDAMKDISSKLGVSTSDLRYYFNTLKKQQEAEAAAAAREGQFNLSEGQARYDANGNLIASRGKTYAPGTGGSGSSGSGGTSGLSSQAKNIIDLINKSGGTVDDYVKGSSNAAQSLRNEVFKGLAMQGGTTEKSTQLFQEAKDTIDKMIKESDWRKFGYSALLGGKKTTGYGDMVARASTVNAILARDNLGLLKGAMSDKDIAFIQAMSAGVPEGTISEKYAKERMESIQKKLEAKVNQYKPVGQQAPTVQASQNNLNDDEIRQLLNEGYTREELNALIGQ